MKFWRAEFAPKCQGESFDKKYAYGVRYNYAKEGKRTDYTPYSCMKIIQTPVPKVGLTSMYAASKAPQCAFKLLSNPVA
jgi:DNA primase large subunit